jgi:hypothetical protein
MAPIPQLLSKKEMPANAMAPTCSTSSFSPPLCSSSVPGHRRGVVAASATPLRSENIVIVGAGVAGLATAVALRQLSVGAVVLEQGPTLHAGGTSLTLFKNGWHVLDAVGVADELRTKYLRIQGCVIYSLKRHFFSVAFVDRCVF